MTTSLPYEGTKRPAWADPNKAEIQKTTAIYKGLVKKVDTGTRSGRLYVYIENFSTNTATDPLGWVLVDYASPFMGKTLGPAFNGAALNTQNDFSNTSQSYGFFMTPPDVGNIVLCCFPDGDRKQGYWFACVNPNLSKNMIPSIGGLPLDKIDPVSIPPSLQSALRPGGIYPVGEFNENTNRVFASNWASAALRPLHIPQFVRLFLQGLDTDANGRGVISSSIQRDPVSSVFGFNTPGRPTNDPANDPALQQKLNSGDFDPQEFVARNRVGGHSLTMDDGDIYGKNNLVKLRTAAGHQLFMNDTDGFMYIANSNGTAWVELTKEGDILVYGARDLSIRTRGNLMMHSDSLIQMNARGPIQMKSAALQVENQATIINSEQAFQAYTNSASIVGKSGVNVVGRKVGITGLGGVSIDGALVALNSGSLGSASSSLARGPSALTQYRMPDTTFVPQQGWTATDGLLQSINYRVPTHEPYVRGNIAAIVEQQQNIVSETLANTETDVDGNTLNPVRSVSLTPGIDSAESLGITANKAATASYFISQPDPGRGLGALDNTQLRAYFAQTGFTESGSRYNTENTFGYQGKYQLGAAALADLGYVKPGTQQSSEALNNPNNWTGKNGVNSALEFRLNGPVQEIAMYEYTKNNYASLQNLGLVEANTPPDQIVGLLSASHLSGTGNVNTWAKTGRDFSDAYGTTIGSYYNQGKYSQTQTSLLAQSDASKQLVSTASGTQFTGT